MNNRKRYFVFFTILCSTLCFANYSFAQSNTKFNSSSDNLLGNNRCFIKNIGQYGKSLDSYTELGKIEFGYEGFAMPILFTKKGIIHLHRKVEKISHEEEEKLEKKGMPEDEIERKKIIINKAIAIQWQNANDNVEIKLEKQSKFYFTYGLLNDKAYGYEKIT